MVTTVMLNNVSADTVSSALAGDGVGRTIHVVADSFGGGFVRLRMQENGESRFAIIGDAQGKPLEIRANRVIDVFVVPLGMDLFAEFTGETGSSKNVRVVAFT